MVGIFTGAGFGFERGSASVLGGSGLLGSAGFGRAGESVFVNAASGNLVLQRQDEYVTALGPSMDIARTYNALASYGGDNDNGDRWRQSTDRLVHGLTGTINTAGSTIKRTGGDGAELTYTWDSSRSAYVAKDGGGSYKFLYRQTSGWLWHDPSAMLTEEYADSAAISAGNVITRMVDRNNYGLDYNYSGGKLQTISANGQTYVEYAWSGNNITQINVGYLDVDAGYVSSTRTRTYYHYDSSNRLDSVTTDLTLDSANSTSDGKTYGVSYSYDTNGRIATISQTDGSLIAIEYDGSGRVTRLRQTHVTGEYRDTTLTYNTGYTVVTDPLGQTTRLDYDTAGNLVKVTSPPAVTSGPQQITEFVYDSATGDLLKVKDAYNAETVYSSYNANGFAGVVTDRLGNTVTRTFDSYDRVLTETWTGRQDITNTSVSLTKRNAYDALHRLRYEISAEGRVTEYRYDSFGRNEYVIDYPAQIYASGTTAPSETQMNTWRDAISDRSTVQVTKNTFDLRNNLSQARTYSEADSYGTGVSSADDRIVTYTYDTTGKVLSRTIQGQNTETFVYDGLGHLVATTDVNGGTTTFVFADTSTTHTLTVTSASGMVTTETLNRAGERVSTTQSGSGSTDGAAQYAYDKLGRVRIVTDANGYDTYAVYDHAGNRVAAVEDDGSITEFRYDLLGRLVGTIAFKNAVSSSNLAALANPDADIAIASLRPSTSSDDVASWMIYDSEGRLRQTIAGDGSTAISDYDGFGRLVRTTAFTSKIAASTVAGYLTAAPTAVVTPAASSTDGITRVFYDADGLLIGSLDGEGYLTRNVYDGDGQLLTATRYAGATTSSLRASGTFVDLCSSVATSASDRVTRNVWDGQGRLRFTIDETLHVTRLDYDAAGNVTRSVAYANALASTYSSWSVGALASTIGSPEANSVNRVSYAFQDAAGRLLYSVARESADSGGRYAVTAYTYDNRGQVTRSESFGSFFTGATPTQSAIATWVGQHTNASANRVTRTWYSARGEVRYVIDAEGYISRRDYDAKGQLVASSGWETKFTVADSYTLAQVAAAISGSPSTSHQWDYDALGRVWREADALGSYTRFTYHGASDLRTSVTRGGASSSATDEATTQFAHDAAGRITQTVDAAGASEQTSASAAFDGQGQVVSRTDARSNTTYFTYDLDGRVRTITETGAGVTTYDYNAFGEAWRVTDPNGNVTHRWFDGMGRETAVRDAANYITTTSYDAFGGMIEVNRWLTGVSGTAAMLTPPAPSGGKATTTFIYDNLGSLLSTTDAQGNGGAAADTGESRTEVHTYNALGQRITTTNRLGATTTFAYDRVGQVVSTTISASWSHISASTGTTTTGSSISTVYEYDSRGNRTKMTEASGLADQRITLYSYDADNRLTVVTHPAVQVVADDMTTLSTVSAPTEQFAYDRRGNLTRATDAAGAQTYSYYDDLDRKVAEIRQVAGSDWVYSAFSYDPNGNLTEARVYEGYRQGSAPALGGTPPAPPAGLYRATVSQFDALNRVTATWVVSQPTNAVVSGTWDGTTWNWDSQVLATYFEYDYVGNLVKTTDPNGGVTRAWFDTLGRKTAQLDAEHYITKWQFDAEGNVLSETRFATKFTGTPGTSSAPSVATAADDRTTDFTYDLNGNRLSETRRNVAAWNVVLTGSTTGSLSQAGTDAIIAYTYNALGQVRTRTVAGVQVASHVYDANGRMMSEGKASFTDANGTTVTPTTNYVYQATGELSSVTQVGAGGTYAASDRTTTFAYDSAGRLVRQTDAEGYARTYFYDVMGRLKKEQFDRVVNANDSSTADYGNTTTRLTALIKTYDLGGRVLNSGTMDNRPDGFGFVESQQFQYNPFDQVTKAGFNSTSVGGADKGAPAWQIENVYDPGGRLVASNAADGTWKYYGYDHMGNQTAVVSSSDANIAGISITTALQWAANGVGSYGADTINATYTVYDKRNQAVQVVEEGRTVSASDTSGAPTTPAAATLTTARTYNAFGEVAGETNALGAAISYTYNTMGRVTRTASPGVWIYDELGYPNFVRPSEEQYYDLGGRLIGMRDANGTYATQGAEPNAPTAKTANTGNLTTYQLLAGTGYDGAPSLVVTEFHTDGKKQTLYDVMGDARILLDELYSSASGSEHLHKTEQTFNRLGYVTQVKHGRSVNETGDGSRLVDNYAYDQLGQMIQHHTNQYPLNVYGAVFEKTAYDAIGRVISHADFRGDVTTTRYDWDGTMVTSGMTTSSTALGGWIDTTTHANTRTTVAKTDLFGREVSRTDLGGHTVTSAYRAAGTLATRADQSFTWTNTGHLASVDGPNGLEQYRYDKAGNRIGETLTVSGSVVRSASGTYDALSRMVTWQQAASVQNAFTTPAASMTWRYDAAGNVRATLASRGVLDASGASSGTVNEDNWFLYDSRNRLVLDKGMLSGTAGASGTQIVRKGDGKSVSIGYDAAGQRVSVARTEYADAQIEYEGLDGEGNPIYNEIAPAGYREARENYTFDGVGRLTRIALTAGDVTAGAFSPTVTLASAATTGGTVRSTFTYNLMGRLSAQRDYNQNGFDGTNLDTNSTYRRELTWGRNGRLESDLSTTLRGSSFLYSSNFHTYTDASSGEYLLGAIGQTVSYTGTRSTINASLTGQNTVTTTSHYQWWDGALQDTVTTQSTGTTNSTNTATFSYGAQGQLMSSSESGGRYRSVTWTRDALGQVLRRDESDSSSTTTGDPHEVWYRFAGREVGQIGNNGSDNLSAAGAIADRNSAAGSGAFRNGANALTGAADFDGSYTGYNTYYQGSASGGYTVQSTGETLRSVARMLWGDANLWYKLADANGITGSETALAAGQVLAVPAGVTRSSYSVSTLKPYDPSAALGEVSPTNAPAATPKPPKANKCGAFGQILLAVVAIAVTALLKVPVTQFISAGATATSAAGIAGAAVAGVAGSIASQTIGVATGIQDKFNWGGVALAGIGAGVGSGLSASGFGIANKFAADVARGALGSTITQGIGVATGLQDKFSWVGVAAAGIGAGVGGEVTRSLPQAGQFMQDVAASSASLLANAATRSVIEGSSFGDNVLAALPDAIGGVIGRALGRGVGGLLPADEPAPSEQVVKTAGEQLTGAIVNTRVDWNQVYALGAPGAAPAGGGVASSAGGAITLAGQRNLADAVAVGQGSALALRNFSELLPEIELALGATRTVVGSFSQERIRSYEKRLWPSLLRGSWDDAKSAIVQHFQPELEAYNRTLVFNDEHRAHFEAGNSIPLAVGSWEEEVPVSGFGQMMNSFASTSYGAATYGFMGLDVPEVGKLNPRAYKVGEYTGYAAMVFGAVAGGRAAGRAVAAESGNVASNAALHVNHINLLRTTEAANPLVDSLRVTGSLPANYFTKADAALAGWQPGKALENFLPGGQVGGDIFRNSTNLVPGAAGRIWREADVGLVGTMSRANQPGTRLLYSNEGHMYVTFDHYGTAHPIGRYK